MFSGSKNDNFQLFIQKRGEYILEKIKLKVKVQSFTEPEKTFLG